MNGFPGVGGVLVRMNTTTGDLRPFVVDSPEVTGGYVPRMHVREIR